MRQPDGVLQYGRLRAPGEHGDRLIEPPLSAIPSLLAQVGPAAHHESPGGLSAELAQTARRRLIAAAQQYTAADGVELPRLDADRPLLLTGHQPELFHPGVWFKNFVAAHLAKQLGGHALHLLIDNDLCRHHSIRVPAGSERKPIVQTVAFDRGQDAVPFEERTVADRGLFHSFAARIQETVKPFVDQPMAAEMWPAAIRASHHRFSLGECFAEARRSIERQWGVVNCEIPLSVVCDQEPFLRFASHLLTRLPELHKIHNASLLEYRQVNRVRSHTHPVPELQAVDDWLEAPFWIWSRSDPQRRALFVRRVAGQLELSDRADTHWRIAMDDQNPDRSFQQLSDFRNARKLRPRALITTMYARLFLADLFVHGIGGAKYDQLTDMLIHRFFGVDAPVFLVATATAKLPIARPSAPCGRLSEIDQTIRKMKFQPDRFIKPTAETISLAKEKAEWITTSAPESRKRRHHEITRINAALHPYIEHQRQELLQERETLAQQCRVERILGSREYSLSLFPERTLQPLLLDF